MPADQAKIIVILLVCICVHVSEDKANKDRD